MKKLLNYLLLFPFIINAQIATIDIIQVKDGMEDDYEAVEAFVAPIQKEAIKQGRKFAWYILKRVSGGDLSEIEDKGIGDYMIINSYASKEQMESDNWDEYTEIAKKVYKGKMSSRKITQKMSSLINPRKDTRSYVIENIYWTKPNLSEEANGQLVSIFPAEALSDDYEKFEMEFFRHEWEKNILLGNHLSWNFNRIIDRSDNAYQNLTHIIFNRGVPGAKYVFADDFKSAVVREAGFASRKGFNGAEMKLIFMELGEIPSMD